MNLEANKKAEALAAANKRNGVAGKGKSQI